MTVLCVLVAARPTQAQNAVITEIFYHPANTNVLEAWFELFNAGTNTINLSGARVTKGVAFNFPTNTLLAPGNYLVVAAHGPTFASLYSSVTNVVAGWTGNLSRDGETIQVEDAAGNTVAQVSYAPEGDWAVRRIGAVDALGRQGWEWFAEHDGLGKSLELVNVAMPNGNGQNWSSSIMVGGTPGRANSAALANIAPIIADVQHAPLIPSSSDPVTISARILDEHTNGRSATLNWRVDGAGSFTPAAMSDDGAHGDGLAGDGIFGAVIPAQADRTIVEFYVNASDLENNTRTYPSVIPSGSSRTANLLYEVDNSAYAGSQAVFRLIMSLAESNYLATQIWGVEPRSDALVNGTFINTDGVLDGGTTTQVRYQCGFRNRGHGTRTAVPHNFHVAFPKDNLWKGRTGINLNTHYTHSQQLGSAVFRRLGIPMADSRPVQVRVNGANLAKPGQEQFGSYAANEVVDDQLVKRQFPLDSEGNLYRGVRDLIPGIDSDAGLAWHGASYTAYTNAYVKENNKVVNDWSDFIQLINVLTNTDDATYVGAVSNVANVDEWMKYFAVNTLLDNQENSLGIGAGDDFALYRGTNDTRFLLLPYDMDAVQGRGLRATTYADGLWRATNVAAINRFMKRNEFVPAYFRHLKELAETTFAPERMNPLLDQLLTDYVDATTIANMKAFNASHRDYVLSLLPLTLTAQSDLPVTSGYPRTTTPTVVLFGGANAIETRTVLVNGALATYSAWEGRWTNNLVALRPGLNHITVQALGVGGVEAGRTSIDVWYDDGTVVGVGGAVAANTTWTAAGGPYNVTASVTVNSGVTLTIEAGACVYFASGASLTVANGGRLLAEGTTNAPILFTRAPGTATTWGGITINGGAGSPETRIINAHFEGNGSTAIHSSGGTVFLDHLTFGNTAEQYVSLDGSSFVVSHCVFPTATAAFELLHGTGGIKSGGRGIIAHNFFGATQGYNDVIDFTGGNRPSPILQVINNVFIGSSDDLLDVDGTDAWVEGNIFLHTHKNGSPDSASAVSGGSDSGNVSDVTVIGNIFYDCDQAATAKQGNFYTLINNTIVHQTKTGGLDTDAAVVNLADDGTTEGAGIYLEGNIVVDAEKLTRNLTAATLTFSNNLMPFTWIGPGGNNSTADPRLKYIPQSAETYFTSWEQAQVMRDWFSLSPGSPARGTGPNGRDKGGVVTLGASISGEPVGTNNQTTATLTAGVARTGSGIPAGGFPNGSGYTHYRYRLDGGAWSAERTITTPIALSGLANDPHRVDVSGKRDSGFYQDDADFGVDALITQSRTWVVNTSYVPPARPTVRLNEILAKNSTTLTNAGATPDLIELHNFGASAVDLSGMGLSDNAAAPYKFNFPANTTLAPGAYLVLYADSAFGAPGIHTGFSLKQEGDDLSLNDKPASGGALLDSVPFGLQLADYSIGRTADGVWTLCRPTFGAANFVQACGNQRTLKINEWLADAQFVADNDFVELYNSDQLPVALGGLFLSDAAGSPARNPIGPLSFIAGSGFAKFIADGNPGQGPDHLNFKLSPDVGLILLSAPDLTTIDCVVYSSQRTDISQGRSPNGSEIITAFTQPSPGGNNPGGTAGCTVVTETIPLLPLNATWSYNQGANLDGVPWQATNYVETGWGSGPALLAVEDCNCLPAPGIGTTLAIGRITYYFRTTFVVNTNLAGWTLNMRTVLDDGAIIYLNGTELPIPRIGMNNGTQVYTNRASRNVGNAGVEFFTFPSTLLQPGTNVVAVEVHQTSPTSTDIVWGMGLDASRSTTNCNPLTTTPVVINEILANNQSLTNVDGKAPDWVELFNTSTNALDLDGCSLTDDPSFPRKWVFTSGSTIAGRGQFVIYCDDTSPISSTNTGFALKSGGSAFYLFDKAANGGALLDALNFGLQTPDFSLGRVPNGAGAWTLNLPTPGSVNSAAGLANPSALRINEWMADPTSGDDWFELYNSAAQPVALGGLVLTDNLADKTQSPIAPLSFIGVGANGFLQFIADGLPDKGNDHVNFGFKKEGEALGVFSPVGVQLSAVGFGPQQTGVSQGRFPDGGVTIVSFVTTPSPAESNYLPLTNAVVNEVLTHTDPPLEDAIELSNPTAALANIGGWYLSNSKQDFKKFRIPDGATLAANGFIVFYETQFNAGSTPFTFNSARGDSAILSAADALGNLTGYRSEVKFGGAENGASFGRYPTSVGSDFTTLAARTFGRDNPTTVAEFRLGTGLPNSGPKIGPVVVSEIMYYSVGGGFENPDEEFIEVQNITASPVRLYDPAYPTNTWRVRDAVDFEFPRNVTLAANGRILLVNFSPTDTQLLAAFRAKFNVPPSVPIFGPWSGRLANDSDSIELVKPDAVQLPPHPDAGYVPQVLVDKVRYSALAPWPAAASGGSNSLQRIAAANYGNDPVNWQAAAPTAGRANGGGGDDSDGDGLPDSWELTYFGNLLRDGSGDFDGDGQTDLQEYWAGTEPTNPLSNLRIISVIHNGANFVLRFTAVAGRTYTMQYRDLVDSGSWSKLADVSASPSTGPVDVIDSGVVGNTSRFYRVVSPASP
jgi:CotH protein/lamin tail-like protein